MAKEQVPSGNKDSISNAHGKWTIIDFSRINIPGVPPFVMPKDESPYSGEEVNKQKGHKESRLGALVKKLSFRPRGERL